MNAGGGGSKNSANLVTLKPDAFEDIPTGYQLLDTRGRIISVNEEWCSIFGCSREEATGRHFDEFLDDAQKKRWEEILPEIACSGTVKGLCLKARTLEGSGRKISFSGRILHGESESEVRIQCFLLETGTEDDGKRELDLIADRFEALGELVPMGIFLTDWKSGTFYTNRFLREIAGISADESTGFGWTKIVYPEDRYKVLELALESVRDRGEFTCVFRIVRPDGALRWLKVRSAPLRASGARSRVRFGTAEDITERKALESALAESQHRFQSIADRVDLGIFVINLRMELLSANRRVMDMTPGLDLSALPKCYEAFCDPPRTDACPHCPVVYTMRTGKVREAVIERNREREKRQCRITASPVMDEKGDIAAVVVTDEEAARVTGSQEESQKDHDVRSMSVLTGGIAHDYKNILASLMGNISLIKTMMREGPVECELIDEVVEAGERARRLTHQLELFSRCKVPVKQRMKPAGIIRQSAEFALRGRPFSCTFDLPDSLPDVDIDPYQIERVVNNLVLNAVQAMEEGGSFEISAAPVDVEVGSGPDITAGRYVRVEFVDRGHGIRERDIGRVFDPFFTTRETGTGLGLSLCRMIVRNHCGDIVLESVEGEGTRTYVYLPVAG